MSRKVEETSIMKKPSLQQQRIQFELTERVKELTCIYNITRIGAETHTSLGEMFTEIANIVPDGFLHPEHTCCRIVYGQEEFTSGDYRPCQHVLTERLLVNDQDAGFVEVGYLEDGGLEGQYPFLKEEQPLLMTISRELSKIAERKLFLEERERIQLQLLHADRLATIGQLTAGVAHEINEPLLSILGFTELVKRHKNLPQDAVRDLDKIINAALHAREIIRKLMIFSRQHKPVKQLVDLNERIEDSLILLEIRLRKSSVSIHKDLSPELPNIEMDPSQLQQVLVNLLVNAIQAMPDGGQIEVQTRHENDKVRILIKDTGKGIDEDELQKIFMPFYTNKADMEGTGLGLPVVLGIVQAHEGTIHVESRKGIGTSFVIQLPAKGGLS